MCSLRFIGTGKRFLACIRYARQFRVMHGYPATCRLKGYRKKGPQEICDERGPSNAASKDETSMLGGLSTRWAAREIRLHGHENDSKSGDNIEWHHGIL